MAASAPPHASNPVLKRDQAWEGEIGLVYPYVLRENQTWIMFYASGWNHPQGAMGHTAIGMATSGDGLSWTKWPDNPILTPTPQSSYDSVYTSSQSAIWDGDHYKMFYASRIDKIHKYFAIALATHEGRFIVEQAS